MEVEGRFEEFSNVDNNLKTAGILTEDEISAVILSDQQEVATIEDEPSCEDFDEPVQCPSVSKCQSSLGIVRCIVTCHGDSSHLDAMNSLDELVYRRITNLCDELIYAKCDFSIFCKNKNHTLKQSSACTIFKNRFVCLPAIERSYLASCNLTVCSLVYVSTDEHIEVLPDIVAYSRTNWNRRVHCYFSKYRSQQAVETNWWKEEEGLHSIFR